MKILIYGDSNTYGYDPADMYDQRYPRDCRWTTLLQEAEPERWEIIPEGMNGRQVPDLKYEADHIKRMLMSLQTGDLFAVMLGTNDVLLTTDPNAERAITKMRSFLEYLTGQRDAADILVVAPPHIGMEGIRDQLYRRYYEESVRMNAGFRELAASFHVNYADAGSWKVDMSADLVHLSETGHRQFAERMREYIVKEILHEAGNNRQDP